MNVIAVGFECDDPESVIGGGFRDFAAEGARHGAVEDPAAVAWYPHEVIARLAVRPSSLSVLQCGASVPRLFHMASVAIIPLRGLPKSLFDYCRDAQVEAGRCWSDISAFHPECRMSGKSWPRRKELQDLTRGRYALHSQTVQAIFHQLLANVDAAMARRRSQPHLRSKIRLLWREKRFFALYWPGQAVSYDAKARRIVLPMGRGRRSLVFKVDINFAPGAVKLVWNGDYELHIVRGDDPPPALRPVATAPATVDLDEIHLAAVVTDNGKACVISGRGIRSDKHLLLKQHGALRRKRSRCTKGSRRWRRLSRCMGKRSRLTQRRVRDKRNKATRQVVDFAAANDVGSIYIGDPRGVRQNNCGRIHNQRTALWEMGKDIAYISNKAKKAGIACSTGDERGTSSRCPQCCHRRKPCPVLLMGAPPQGAGRLLEHTRFPGLLQSRVNQLSDNQKPSSFRGRECHFCGE